MRILFFTALIAIFFGCNTEEKETTTKGRLHIIIPESIAPVMIDEVENFLSLYKESGAHITYTIASSEAATNIFLQDTGRIAYTLHPLTLQEKENTKKISPYFNELIVAYDGIVVIVHATNELNRMTTTDIQNILSGKATRWEQLPSNDKQMKGTIKFYCQDTSDELAFLKHRLSINTKKSVKITNTLSDINTIQSVENDPMSIGVVALSWIDSVKSQAKVLELGRTKEDTDTSFISPPEADGKFYLPHPAYIFLNYYPLKRAVYMYTRTQADLAAGFGTYVATTEGQKIILKHGLLPGTQKIKLKSTQP
jgi:phosphate transport system substrate-binding protein